MATATPVLCITKEAGEDLSSDQYKFVVLDTSTGKVRRPDSATEIALGVLQNAPASGEGASVCVIGVSKIHLGATLTAGVIVGPEYVSATDAGKAKAPAATNYPAGLLLEGGSEDDLGSVLLGSITVKA